MDKSFSKGLAVLEDLARSGRPRGVTELARDLGLQKSNAHRLLQTLVMNGFAQQDPETGRYQASLKLWELGTRVLSRLDLRDFAEPHLLALARHCGMVVNLAIRDGIHVIFIERLEHGQPTRAGYVGMRVPAHALATGKVLLAHAPEEIQAQALIKPQAFTDKTITAAPSLKAEFARIRKQGYATNRGEWRELINSVAMPVRDAQGTVAAAVGITGPIKDMSKARIEQLLPALREAAAAITRRLGGPATPITN